MRGDAGFPVRIRFTERGKVRFISHRDVARAFERAFRVEQLPLAFTAGFSPRPKVSFGLALSVGHESDAEYLDVELREPIVLEGLATRLSVALPEGIDVTGVAQLRERAPALQESVTEVHYRVAVAGADGEPVDEAALRTVARDAWASTELPVTRTRKGREGVDDLRPAILTLEVDRDHDDVVLLVALTTRPRGARPREVLDALGAVGGLELSERRVRRTAQWIERLGARLEPLAADAFAPALEARAS